MTWYLFAVNMLSFVLMGDDKRRAKRGERRIAEKTLFLSAAAGGSIGAIVGMVLFRHKTRHLRFVLGLPVILLIQLTIFLLLSLTF